MTVKELIAVLQGKPDHLQVAYRLHSEYCLLRAEDIHILSLSHPRPDGWIHDSRPDRETMEFLVFPGN